LRAAEERIREQAALLDQAREAIVVQDLQRKVTYWSKGAERVFGWSAEEAARGDAETRVPPLSQTDVDIAWEVVLQVGQWDGTLRHVRRDGAEIVLESHWTSLRDAEGALRAVLSINSDVTAAHNLEAQLLRSQRLETVGMVASGIAHDLNNVLAPILMGISGLKNSVNDERGVRLLKAMEVSADRGTDIVRQVVTFARGTSGVAESIDVRDCISGIEGLLKATLPGGVSLELRVPEAITPMRGNPTQLHQVLLNLCVNARDAMPTQNGELLIEASAATVVGPRAGEFVRIRVADNGHGMSREVQERIFEPFFTTKQSGTGIGLATVRTIVERHGGFVEVESEAGRGTEFRLYFPVAEGAAKAALPPVPVPAPAVAAETSPLLILDEGMLREIMRETLTAYGYQVLAVTDAAETLSLYAEHRARHPLVLANLSMSGLDAADLLRRLGAENPRARVIDTSGSEIALRDRTLGTVVRATLSPPYSPATLIEVVGRVIEAP
jgi:two-component system cell cycle sensor histidine kinase/response regulator CckA